MELPRITKADSQANAEFIRSELLLVPDHLRRLVTGAGYEWFSLPTADRYRFHGIDRAPASRSYCDWSARRFCLIDKVERLDGFSTVLHELGHALDHVLGWPSYSLTFQGKPLDWYAAKNPAERFAQAFEAYWRADREPCPWYAVHTQEQLRKQEPDLYTFVEGICDHP